MRLALLIFAVTPLLAQPKILQIYRDRLKPGIDGAYTKIENDARRLCAQRCPNAYLAARSLGGHDEVWFLNFYDSDAEVEKIKRSYGDSLQADLKVIADRKKDLILTPQESFGYFQDDISGGAPMNPGEIRYVAFTTTTFDPDHLKYSEIAATGWVYRLAEGTMIVVNPLRTRPANVDPNTRLFEVKPSMSNPAKAWIAADPAFWK